MPVKVEMASTTSAPAYRPQRQVLDIFWTLADGTDEQRTAAALKLTQLIKETKEEELENIVAYCSQRLIKGLSSGRKFARVGFAVALAELIRKKHLKAKEVFSNVNEKLKPQRHERNSKSEIGGIFLGRAFGFSSIVQSGCLNEMGGESLSSMTEELLTLADKKSYLKAVCSKTLENLVSQVSVDDFGEHIWPKLRDTMKLGWESATLDTLSLLLACRAKFPDVVNKKFLKKHWGFPVLGEENDDKLFKSSLETAQRAEILLNTIIPTALEDGRPVDSLWNSFAEKLMVVLPEKKAELMVQRQTLGMKIAHRLLVDASSEQVQSLVLTPSLARCIFHNITRRDDPQASAADLVFEQLCTHLKSPQGGEAISTLDIVKRLWKFEAELDGQHRKGDPRVDIVGSANFLRLLDVLKKEEAEEYAETLMTMVKGKDIWEVLSENSGRKSRQNDSCLRHLQHLLTSTAATFDLQSKVLTLMLRLSYFKLDKKVKGLQHCETCVSFSEGDATQKLCKSLLYKSLNAISTSNTGHLSQFERDSYFIKLLLSLCQYVQDLLSSKKVESIVAWSEDMQKDWDKCFKLYSNMKLPTKADEVTAVPGFMLLLLYLSLQLLTEPQATSEMLQDVYICCEKAFAEETKGKKDSDETAWIEVLTEVLLHMMSLPSHLGRVITSSVFRMLTGHMTPQAVRLISEVLIPKKTRDDDAGGVMVENQGDEEEEEDDDDDDEIDDDVSEESDEGEDGDGEEEEEDNEEEEEMDEDDDEDDDEEEEENVEVDEAFRESVKQALGQAADLNDSDDEEKEMSDLSDSEMFKLDDMLAEVFRQRKKAGAGKKAKQEKRAELANFRLRVLDLVENMIKSPRIGDFLLDLLKPLLLLSMRARTTESQSLCSRANALFMMLKSKVKPAWVKDNVHSTEEQNSFFEELLQLAQKASDPSHVQTVATASFIVMNISKDITGDSKGCMKLFKEALSNVINKKQSKPHFTFFTSIIEMSPDLFHFINKDLLANLKDENVKVYNKTLCCTILSSLFKKIDVNAGKESSTTKQMTAWMTEAASTCSQIIDGQEKGSIKTMLVREVLQLMLVIQARCSSLGQAVFDDAVKVKLGELKSKFNTDLRKLAKKVIAGIDRSSKQGNTTEKKKKRKLSETEAEPEQPQKKKKKNKPTA